MIFSARGCYVPHIFPRLVYHFCIPSLDRYEQAWSCCLECVPILRPNLRSSAAIALRTCVLFVSWSGEQAGPGRRQGGRRGRGESPGAAADSHGRLPREGRIFSRRRRRGHQQVISDIIHRLFCVLLSQHGATKAVNSAVHVVPSMRLHPPKLRWCCSAFTLLVLSSLKKSPALLPTWTNTHTHSRTRRPGAIDPALRRPGRFDQELALAPPDVRGRADILRHHLKGVEVKLVDVGGVRSGARLLVEAWGRSRCVFLVALVRMARGMRRTTPASSPLLALDLPTNVVDAVQHLLQQLYDIQQSTHSRH